MKKILLIFITALCSVGIKAQSVVFMPQWTQQSQHVGFYIALEKGYYAQEGLDLTIKHITVNSTEPPVNHLLSGDVQFLGQQLLQTIVYRSKGAKLVNVMQLSQNSSLWCLSRKKINNIKDLDGLRVGRWKAGFTEVVSIIEQDQNIKINWVPFIFGINLYIYKAVDATLCYSYSEFIKLLFSLGEIDQNNLTRFEDMGYNYPEDAIYVTEDYYNAHRDVIDKFVRASKKGWDYAREHQDEALALSMKYVKEANIGNSEIHQKLMLEEVLRLQINNKTGIADYQPVSEELFNEINKKLYDSELIPQMVPYKDLIK